jgi:hypothetical protein
MSNNPNWKRSLQDKINLHNRQHGSKPKGVSNKTMHERACSLFRSFTLLRRLGYQIDPAQLAGRHIQMLVDSWTGNARIVDRCRQRGVAMLERPHSTPYIEQQLSFLRVYADTWIRKPGMVHPLAVYVDDPARFKRSYTAKEDRGWEGNQVEFTGIVETVEAIDPRVAAQLALSGASDELVLANIAALIDNGGQITLGALHPIECVAIANDDHNSLAMLRRRPGETLPQLLQRLDAAIDLAWNVDQFTDEINPPPSAA